MSQFVYNPLTGEFEIGGGAGGGGGAGAVFTSDITVSLQGGNTFGQYGNGDVIPATGLTAAQVIELAVTEFQVPDISSFSIQGQSTTIEVGTALSGTKTFQWGITNSGNVVPNSLNLIDVSNGNNPLISGGSISSPQSVNIGTVTNNAPITQTYRLEIDDTQGGSDTRNYNIQSIYPYFFGKVASGGAAPGASRPVANQALIDSGTKVVSSSNGTISVNFASSSDDYIWFAIPSSSTSKTVWFENALNNGAIGGAVEVSGNLFPDFDTLSVTTVNWAGVNYKVYISNFQTTANTLQLRNS